MLKFQHIGNFYFVVIAFGILGFLYFFVYLPTSFVASHRIYSFSPFYVCPVFPSSSLSLTPLFLCFFSFLRSPFFISLFFSYLSIHFHSVLSSTCPSPSAPLAISFPYTVLLSQWVLGLVVQLWIEVWLFSEY